MVLLNQLYLETSQGQRTDIKPTDSTVPKSKAQQLEQKLQEAQEIAEAVLDAEAKIGELTSKMEKKQGFASIHDNGVGNTKTKQLEEIGINQRNRRAF